MSTALIGHSGFVGSTLHRQTTFDGLYRSTDIANIEGREYDLAVCAGAPAQKWRANADPESDAATIDSLMRHLAKMTCRTLVLISTVDVFRDPRGVDEQTTVDRQGLHAYGLNRRRLEEFVSERFERSLIVRLPGLVGPGLRKNVIFDLLHDNNLESVDSRGVFQFYPMVNLWWDIEAALTAGLDLVHLTAAPVSVRTIAERGFGRSFDRRLDEPVAEYDFRTVHSETFGSSGRYQYSEHDTLMAVRAYAQSGGSAVGEAT